MMKCLLISDTHSKHREFTDQIFKTDADVLVHTGDITDRGYIQEAKDFLNWYSQFTHIDKKLFICGNHDFCAWDEKDKFLELLKEYPDLTYLHEKSIDLIDPEDNRSIKFYGSNYTPKWGNWPFMYPRGQGHLHCNKIPADTNVLLTHGPVWGKVDLTVHNQNVGCLELLAKTTTLQKLKLHVCGHIHSAYGQTQDYSDSRAVKYVNAALVDEGNYPVHKPILIEL